MTDPMTWFRLSPRPFFTAVWVLCLCVTTGAFLPVPVGAQQLPPELDPFPPDPRLQLSEYFRTRLPPLWWANEPDYNLGLFTIQVNIPADWEGNPTGAAASLCPEPGHRLWQAIKQFEIRPFYKQHNWASVTCRP